MWDMFSANSSAQKISRSFSIMRMKVHTTAPLKCHKMIRKPRILDLRLQWLKSIVIFIIAKALWSKLNLSSNG